MNNQININPSYKVIADHLRSCAFLISDGVLPSNEGRGYVLRRIMRRAMRHIHKLQTTNPTKKEQKNNQTIMHLLVPALIKEMGEAYPEIIIAKDVIIETLKNEEEKFRETLEKGLKILEEELQKISQNSIDKFSGIVAFKLYDTYGFPLDLTQDILKEKGLMVNLEEFNTEMEKQKNRGRENWAGSGENKEDDLFLKLKEKFGETKFLGYETLQAKAKILAIIENGKEIEKISSDSVLRYRNEIGTEITDKVYDIDDVALIILDQTPFYATSGGQEGDSGQIIYGDNYINISKTKKLAGNLFGHLIDNYPLGGIYGEFKIGDEVIAKVDQKTRQAKANNHSATHLLHKALKETLGNSISQKGSDVDSGGFTFDFNFNRPIEDGEIEKIENLVNEKIRQNTEIKTQIMSLDQAKESGAEALFGEKYDKQVRVLSMGEIIKNDISQDILQNDFLQNEIDQSKQAWSVELCGGTHAKRTGDIGFFKIISESGIASGIRRIEAKTGEFALSYLKEKQKKTEEIIIKKEEQIKQKDKQISVLKKQILLNNLTNLKAENIDGISFYSHIFENCEAKDLREIVNEIKNKKDFQTSSILAFFAIYNEKVALCISLSKDLLGRFDASKLISPAIAEIGGKGGGGKPDLAMGGGDNKNGINNSISSLIKIIKAS